MTKKSHHERAKNKIQFEISKKIESTIETAKNGCIGDLFYYLHYLHFIRLIPRTQNIPDDELEMVLTYNNHLTDVYKYLIQVFYVHSIDDKTAPIILRELDINTKIVQSLTKRVLEINSNYENLTLITMTENLKVYGERDRYLRMDFGEVLDNPTTKKYVEYGFRIDRDNDFHKKNLQLKDDLLNNFEKEYHPYRDLFQNELNIDLKLFVNLIDFLITTITNQINNNHKNFVKIGENKIDVQAFGTIINFANSLFVDKEYIFLKFGKKVNLILNKLTFDVSIYDSNELRFNQVARQPIFDFGDKYLISPELLLDSLFVNLHYTLLEGLESKEKYKEKYASTFIDKIVEISNKYDFVEVDREIDLYHGKNQIGDIDLIIKNSKNQYLLIEAKNHNLPLDVYFHDYKPTKKRLSILQKEWERKVAVRRKHLLVNNLKYGIPSDFKYIIVSKCPEILSHFSKYLTLSLEEFDFYLDKENLDITFQEIFDQRYKMNEVRFTPEQLDQLQSDLSPGTFFRKE